LYRQAIKLVGDTASMMEIADAIKLRNQLNQDRGLEKPVVALSRKTFCHWFEVRNGKQIKVVKKPILTANQKVRRMQWCTDRKYQLKLAEPFYSAFLDEKWFYTRSRRKKQKVLPHAACKPEGVDRVAPKRVSNQ
jgi:hypothetical protein